MICFWFLYLASCYYSTKDNCICYYDTLRNTSICTTCKDELDDIKLLSFCPSRRFRQRLPLWQWLLEEIFCIAKDNRNPNTQQYTLNPSIISVNIPSFNAGNLTQNGGATLFSETTQATNKFGSTILIQFDSNNNTTTPFSFPAPSAISSECKNVRNAEFISPISSICYYLLDDTQLPDQPSTNSTNNTAVNIFLDALNNSQFVNLDGSIITHHNNPFFENITNAPDNSTNETTENLGIFDFNDISTFAEENEDIAYHLSSVKFIFVYHSNFSIKSVNISQYYRINNPGSNVVPLNIDIQYFSSDSLATQLKSGNFGYAFNEPLISLQSKSDVPEMFPVPFGIDGQQTSYTPLLFGVDTLSGFNSPDVFDVICNYRNISRLAQANASYANDWVNISYSNICDNNNNVNIEFIDFKIYYRLIGNVNNPQNMIYKATMDGRTVKLNGTQKFIFKASFLRSADNTYKRFLQPNPRVKGIPPDTFYPFSSEG